MNNLLKYLIPLPKSNTVRRLLVGIVLLAAIGIGAFGPDIPEPDAMVDERGNPLRADAFESETIETVTVIPSR